MTTTTKLLLSVLLTAGLASMPALAQEFALPRALTAKGVRRYGFHGLSYEYIAEALLRVAPQCAHGKVVVAHLGNGASMCAMERGRAVCPSYPASTLAKRSTPVANVR